MDDIIIFKAATDSENSVIPDLHYFDMFVLRVHYYLRNRLLGTRGDFYGNKEKKNRSNKNKNKTKTKAKTNNNKN